MLTNDIVYWVITLKSYASNFALELCKQESFGQEICACRWKDLILANRLIDIMQCYTDETQINSTLPLPILAPQCLDNNDMVHLFGTASAIINRGGKCG